MEEMICLEKLDGEKEEKLNKSKKYRFRLGFGKQMNKGALENNRIKWNG